MEHLLDIAPNFAIFEEPGIKYQGHCFMFYRAVVQTGGTALLW